jgi:hypothetical protein
LTINIAYLLAFSLPNWQRENPTILVTPVGIGWREACASDGGSLQPVGTGL